MKSRGGFATLLFGLALLPGWLPAGEGEEPAKPPRTRVQNQLNRLIRAEAGLATLPAPAANEPEPAAEETLLLEPMIIEEPKLKDLPPPEPMGEKFFRTGTVWQKIGPKFTKRFWIKGGGPRFTISW